MVVGLSQRALIYGQLGGHDYAKGNGAQSVILDSTFKEKIKTLSERT